MIGRANFPLVLSIWLVVLAISGFTGAERWSRQVSNSEWIPLANPRNQQGHNQNLVPQLIPQVHQPLIPGSLPPELRQEYQQQLVQLQKTQESIQRLLLLQQQLKAQQQLLQGQSFLPNGMPESEENKQALHQSAIANAQTLPELAPEVLVPPQLSGQSRPPVYSSQNFHEPQGEAIRQEQYEDYREAENYGNPERAREELREKERYVPETPSDPANDDESNDDGEEEVQVVYVPAEILAQRGQTKNQQRGRDRKQFGTQDQRHHQQRPYSNQQGSLESGTRQNDNVPTTVSPEDDAYAREFLQQLQREHEGTDRLLKEAREKELERLREERKEIQRRAKLQQAAVQREQEIQRQREAEKERKELAKLEEAAKQRELERIRESRERQRLEEMERSRKVQARANEEKRKQEEARQAEIERLAVLERQKKAEIERTIAAQKDLERIQKEDEERGREAERSHLSRQKETSRIRQDDTKTSPKSQPLIGNQHNRQQHLTQSGKYNRHGRIRNKPRQRQHSQNIENSERTIQEITTMTPPSPNQPPLAVYMSNLGGNKRVIRITDVLKTLKDAKTIDVLDNVGQNAPQVFVGPSNLEVPGDYAKFELPYLSSIDNNRVERRVDKLPFFVAPLSFNPPPGYSKIPFPAPHIGSVVINTLDSNISITQPDGSLEEVEKSNLSPLIQPNSFSDDSAQGIPYSTSYDSSTTASYANSQQEEPSSTPQYQSSPSYSTVEASGPSSSYRFRQPLVTEPPSGSGSQGQSKLNYHDQYQVRPTGQEESPLPLAHNIGAQYNDDFTRSTTPVYRRPNVVTSFAYQESPQPVSSSTPTYQESYSNVRDESSNGPANSQLTSVDHDTSQHREVVNSYQLTDDRKNERGQEYSNGQVDSGVIRYVDSPTGSTQYNLPADLPGIHPQLPGLVNSLLDEGEQTAFINRHPSQPTTTSTTTAKTITTTETPITTQRSRSRHRGRLVATRPSTTTTTTLSPPSKNRDNDRTRRPFGRTRTRFTTTTEEYRESYEPTKTKVAVTTPRDNVHDNYRRPVSTKTEKQKNRETEGSPLNSRNQVHHVQAHEAVHDGNPSFYSKPREPEITGIVSNEPVYAHYDFPSATTSLENYPSLDSDGRRVENMASEVEYSKTLNSPQPKPSAPSSFQGPADSISQQFEERYPTSDFSQTGLEDAPVNGFNYQIRNEQATTTPAIPPASREFAYYQNKQETFENSRIPEIPTKTPIKSQLNDYQRPALYQNSDFARPQSHFPTNEEKNTGFEVIDDGIYDPYSRDDEDGLTATGSLPEHAPLELTTEALSTTTTTTEAAPVIIRQKVRARLGGRGRPDSLIQTRPRGSQEEYVRFSAVNNQNVPTTERSAPRHRENHRAKPKTRPQQQGVQVQTEGNDYVRIQTPVRTYQKTIVTPPSTTQRTTTTQNPTTTTLEYETSGDELEYGFIRAPNFAPVHPVENRYQNSYRPSDNQAPLQSNLPTYEATADSIPSPAQLSRNRPKYQSSNRRPTSKAVSSTTLTSETSPYTEKPRTRVEEPKNNRIRIRGRKPGKKRTTTTTTTTTEYVLEETNDLPLEENYPRPVQTLEDLGNHRQEFYNEKFEALPLSSGVATNPVQQQHRKNSFSNQDLLLNFETESDHVANSELDQTQLATQSSRKYGQPGETRSKTHPSHRGSQDRDIYGSESQWSTKLTSNSFQPSPSVNRLTQNDQKSLSLFESEKNKYSNDEASRDAPEVITAPPEESYVTILVTSDHLSENSEISSADASLGAPSMEGTNYGMKTSVESRHTFTDRTTPTSMRQEPFVSSSTEATNNNEEGNYKKSVRENQPSRRSGGRRRRVRVRVRPAASDDFVTAESQHFNSAVNNLLRDRLKYHRREEESRETVATTESSIFGEYVSTETPRKNILDDFLTEVFKKDNKPSEDSEVTTLIKSKEASSASDKTKVFTDQSTVVPDPPEVDLDQSKVISDQSKLVSDQSKVVANQSKVISDQSGEILNHSQVVANESEVVSEKPEIVTNRSDVLSITTNQSEVVGTTANSTNDVPKIEKTTYLTKENLRNVNYSNTNELSTNSLPMTTMTIPQKSRDSTKSYKDSTALNVGEYLSHSKENIENVHFDDNGTGEGNEVFENDYRKETTKSGDNSLSENNEAENYPKNHRSEWSEVRYPTNPENYNRQLNLTTTQLPGIVTKSEGDTSVKTLSDYVKAIFDTMKNADEQKSDNETFSTLDLISREEERVSTSSTESSRTSDNLDNVPTSIPSTYDYSTTNIEKSENSMSDFTESEGENRIEDETQVLENTENSISNFEKEALTEQPQSTEITETTKYIEETTEISTEMNSNASSSLPVNSEFSGTSTKVVSVNPIEAQIDEMTISTIENLPDTKNSTQSKLGAILRTSTTTKVSHMTEICYRGRCVMTKPKKEIPAR